MAQLTIIHQARPRHNRLKEQLTSRPRLTRQQWRALRAAVQHFRRCYEQNGWGRTVGAKFWIGNAEAAIKLLAPEHGRSAA